MKDYNISKYTDDKFDKNGYCADWISIGDIGGEFYDKILTPQEYYDTENCYIKAIYLIVDYLGIKTLKVKDVVKSFSLSQFLDIHRNHMELYNDDIMQLYNMSDNISCLNYDDIGNFCRLLLREDLGAKVFCPRKLHVFICYDFLLGIRSSRSLEQIINEIKKLGLDVRDYAR